MNDMIDNYTRAQQEKRTRISDAAKRFIWVTFVMRVFTSSPQQRQNLI